MMARTTPKPVVAATGPAELRNLAEFLDTTPVPNKSLARNNRNLAKDLRAIANEMEEMLRTLRLSYLHALDYCELQTTASVEFPPENRRLSRQEERELGRKLARYNEAAILLPGRESPEPPDPAKN